MAIASTPAAELAQRTVEAHAAYWRERGCEVHVELGRCVVIHPARQQKDRQQPSRREMSEYIEIWRQSHRAQPDEEMRLRLLIRDDRRDRADVLAGPEIHLVRLGEEPRPQSGVWVPSEALFALASALAEKLDVDPAQRLALAIQAARDGESMTREPTVDPKAGIRAEQRARDQDDADLVSGTRSAVEIQEAGSFAKGLNMVNATPGPPHAEASGAPVSPPYRDTTSPVIQAINDCFEAGLSHAATAQLLRELADDVERGDIARDPWGPNDSRRRT